METDETLIEFFWGSSSLMKGVTVTTLLLLLFGIIIQTIWWLKDRSTNKAQICPSGAQTDVNDDVVDGNDKDNHTADLMTTKMNEIIQQTDRMLKSERYQHFSKKKKEMLMSSYANVLAVVEGITEEDGEN